MSRVAVCGGAGDSLLGAASAAGVDAYVTADLRHHPGRRAPAGQSDVALVDVAHWASEYPWCAQAAELLTSHFGSALPVHRQRHPHRSVEHREQSSKGTL